MKSYLLAAAAILCAAPAYAADLGYVESPLPPAYEAPSDWTGFYVGAFGGLASGNSKYDSPIDATFPYLGNTSGGLFGIQAGANYQINSFVVGGVVDIGLTNIEASAGGGGITINSDLKYLGSVRAKAGYATDTLLAYVHGGAVFGKTETSATVNATGALFDGFHGDDKFGYTLGAGLEVKVSDNISFFTEYAYTGLGDTTVFTNPPGFVDFNLKETLNFHSVKAGLNFHF